MKRFKLLLSFAISILLVFCFIISASAESIELDCNIAIEAICENDSLTISYTNNSNKNIIGGCVFIVPCDDNGEIEGAEFESLISKTAIGKTTTTNPTLYVNQPYTYLKIYPCIVTFEDWTRWGSSAENIEAAKGLGLELAVQNDKKIVSKQSNTQSSISSPLVQAFGSLIIIAIVAVIIVLLYKKKRKKI